ncbi:flavodoxin family protein BilS [Dysosmobacter sp.]|uniref:flavodoxin family protein BilS n=1 Tax=Dysosmobacter sp. TaxID=2591382 RepID=UPI003FD7B2CE
MSYAIVYSSRTGNTAMLARAVREALPQEDCRYFGAPAPQALAADTVYVGFWTDKGTCDEPTARFLQSLTDQKVFLFGTAGFGGAPAYFQQILDRVKANLAPGVQVTGTYMCQGKMPQAVRDRYAAMEESPRRTAMLENFDQALSHPDQEDLARLQAAVGE